MPEVILAVPVRWWHCPSCDVRDRTQQAGPHTQFHNCLALGGVCIPLIEVRSRDGRADGRQIAVAREDYIGQSGAGPVAAISTVRCDGSNDCTVLAPAAVMKIG